MIVSGIVGGAAAAAWRSKPCRQQVLAGLLGMLALAAQGQAPSPSPSRGDLLYQTHCVACHSEKLHWRDARLATDWSSLKAQVRHWQDVAQLRWSEDDIVAVARHLNDTVYHFSQNAGPPASALPGTPRSWTVAGRSDRAVPCGFPVRVGLTASVWQASTIRAWPGAPG
jgi:mono/diheme cytochrome c family protein